MQGCQKKPFQLAIILRLINTAQSGAKLQQSVGLSVPEIILRDMR